MMNGVSHMIRVEFRRPTEGNGYDLAAIIAVDETGIVTITGPDALIIAATAIPHPEIPGARLSLEDNPALWLRNTHRTFWTRYLVPVIVDGA